MEKSIESIWKDGFLKDETLVAPRVNNLYNKKSNHIIDQFKRMFKINIWAIVAVASIVLIISFLVNAGVAGSLFFATLIYVAYTARDELKALDEIDKGQSSYAFLKSFQVWLNNSIERYGKLYRIVYPALILTFCFGGYYSDYMTELRKLVVEKSEYVFYELHVPTTILVLIIAILLSVFSKAIHRKDVGIVYGGIIQRLDETIAEMEELRAGM